MTNVVYREEGAITPAEFAEIIEKTHAISRFLAQVLPVRILPNVPILPKMPNIAKISIKNYFECVMNDVIFQIEFLKFTFLSLIWLSLAEYLILRIFVIHFIRTYC